MSGGDWAAIVVVAAAGLWFGWRIWSWLRRPPGGGCDNCPK